MMDHHCRIAGVIEGVYLILDWGDLGSLVL